MSIRLSKRKLRAPFAPPSFCLVMLFLAITLLPARPASAQGHTYTFTNATGEDARIKPQCIAADCPEFDLPGGGRESIFYYKPYDYNAGWIGVCFGPDSHQVYTENAGRWSRAPVVYLTPDDYLKLASSIGEFLGGVGGLASDITDTALAVKSGGAVKVKDEAFSGLSKLADGPALWHQRNFCRNRSLELVQTQGGQYHLVARPE